VVDIFYWFPGVFKHHMIKCQLLSIESYERIFLIVFSTTNCKRKYMCDGNECFFHVICVIINQ
jgi:hypothetical protein